MAYRVIHLIDSEASNYQWPFKLGRVGLVQDPSHCSQVVGGWFELRSFGRKQRSVPQADGVQVFYRVETPDGREFTEPAQDLEPRSRETL